MMRVILIDPETKAVTEEFIDGTLESYYALLDCTDIQDFYPKSLAPSGHYIHADEEGSFKDNLHYFFIVGSENLHLCGKACIVKAGDDSDTISCTLSVAEIKAHTVFL